MAKVIWEEPALDDLRGIINHIAQDSPVYAGRVGARLVEAPRRLEDFPLSGRIVPEFDDPDIRELIHGVYRIIYVVRGDSGHVVAVIHGSRDVRRHLTPEDWEVF